MDPRTSSQNPLLGTATWTSGRRLTLQTGDDRATRLRALSHTPVELPDNDHVGWSVLLRALGVRD